MIHGSENNAVFLGVFQAFIYLVCAAETCEIGEVIAQRSGNHYVLCIPFFRELFFCLIIRQT